MNPKYSLMFFSGGIILILGFVLIGMIPTNVLFESEQDDDKEKIAMEETVIIQTELNPIEEMNCVELREFIMSFEKGWGNAVALYDEKCS
ncbi:MAG: hypothetical protein OEY10_01605 [Nitrosopumilus sp.]|nr:hypothetical protein [Nitrosopumilus sp.]